jgi:hypothetical protein
MSRRPARCTQADISRAIKAAGPGMAVDILPDGTIRIAPILAFSGRGAEPVEPKGGVMLS